MLTVNMFTKQTFYALCFMFSVKWHCFLQTKTRRFFIMKFLFHPGIIFDSGWLSSKQTSSLFADAHKTAPSSKKHLWKYLITKQTQRQVLWLSHRCPTAAHIVGVCVARIFFCSVSGSRLKFNNSHLFPRYPTMDRNQIITLSRSVAGARRIKWEKVFFRSLYLH